MGALKQWAMANLGDNWLFWHPDNLRHYLGEVDDEYCDDCGQKIGHSGPCGPIKGECDMAQGQNISANRLKDGIVAGFRVSEIKSFSQDVEVTNAQTGMIENVPWTKVQVKVTHDASQPMSNRDCYAVANVDPARPLVLALHTYLIPKNPIDGVPQRPSPAESAPSSDKMRWAFIKHDTMMKILKHSGYVPKSNPPQKFPLPGTVFIEVALSKGNNYPRSIGGEEIIAEKAAQRAELDDNLSSIMEMAIDTSATNGADDLSSLEVETPTDTGKADVKQAMTGKKDKTK